MIERAKTHLAKYGVADRVVELDVSSATPEQAEAWIGHAVGGVCPFGIEPDVLVYLDESLKKYDTVYPACGSSNSMIELSIPELETFSEYKEWVDVGKIREA